MSYDQVLFVLLLVANTLDQNKGILGGTKIRRMEYISNELLRLYERQRKSRLASGSFPYLNMYTYTTFHSINMNYMNTAHLHFFI